ncbi:MAG: FAD:protein FMN transferase, partial [Woeseiaceae bacterium]|nr:FAD:protein FMN transferase [Woeseiaceae bacterium]
MPRLLSASLAPLTAALALTACGSGEPVHEFAGSAFGTSFSVKLVAPPAELDTAGLGREIEAALDRIDRRVSTWRADSEVSRFNAYRGLHWFPVSAETCALVAEALTHSAATAGAFDITVGPIVDLWGFGPEAPGVTPPAAA